MVSSSKKENESFDAISSAITKYSPIISEVSIGSVLGYCSGSAAKTLTKSIAIVVGFIYVGVQAAASKGYINLNWKKIEKDVLKSIDTDGDGKLTADDAHVYWNKLKNMLTHQLPSASGFSAGFLYGFSSN